MLYALVLPLALLLGYMLATPTDFSTLAAVGLVLGVVSMPLVLKWYYESMLLSWHMAAVVFFLPGAPELWLVLAFISFAVVMAQRALSQEMTFISVPSLTWPLLFIFVVVLVTARLTGGIGLRALGGSTFGGRGYIWITGGVLGFFVMISRHIRQERARLCAGLFLLGGFTSIITTLMAFGPAGLFNLALLFPVGGAELEKIADELGFMTGFGSSIARFSGLTIACQAVFCFMLARYGIRQMLTGTGFWRFVVLVGVAMVGSLGGFRSTFILLALTFLLLFYYEGLVRSKYFAIFLGLLMLAGVTLVPFANKLPLSIQRAISVLPFNVDPIARFEAEASTEWRLRMWEMLLPEVPHYLWVGKGLAVSGASMEFSGDLMRRGQTSSQETAILTGTYHNGPLTVIIPFGIWGAIGWLWFLIASIRALYLNHRYGAGYLQHINTFLLAYFVANTIVFLTIYGDFRSQFAPFVGIVGLSVALNGGIRRQERTVAAKAADLETQLDVVPNVPMPAR
jgi:hypothetical protein